MASESIILDIDGVQWQGWESVSITRAIDSVSGSFELSLSDRWTEVMETLPLAPAMSCSIKVSNGTSTDTLIKGYIDTVKSSLNATSHSISVSGRDASADLVDCAAVHSPSEWRGQGCLALATALASPFEVAVTAGANLGDVITVHKVEAGESAWECLERALRQRELLAMPDCNGGIQLATIGAETATSSLVQGENVLSASVIFDARDRFSEYRVLAQQRGSDSIDASAAASVIGVATDDTLGRYRPYVISGEAPKDASSAKTRADWEASVRAGRSVTVNVTVQGFRQSDGTLWPINAMCRVVLPWLRIEQDLLIAKAIYKVSSSGSTTTLTLRSPLAFAQEFEANVTKTKEGKSADLLRGVRELSEAEKEKILRGE